MHGGLNVGIGATVSKFHWFGDSWVAGSELEKLVDSMSIKHHTFANLVSKQFGAECKNFGEPGISNDLLSLNFFRVLSEINPQEDTVFFCLTAQHRVSMLSDNQQPLTILPSINDNHRRINEHPHWKEWYRYFDAPENQIFNYERNINLLYHWCKNIGVKFYFVNLFTTVQQTIYDATDQSAWILPKHQSLSEFIFPITDVEFGGLVLEDRSWLTDQQWQTQLEALKKYVYPCYCHPNLEGHNKIARELIQILGQKNTAVNELL